MAIILDAELLLRGEKGSFDLKAWLGNRRDESFAVTAVTLAVLWQGVERAGVAQRARRQQYLQRVLAPLPVLPYTEQTAQEHARIWAQLEAAGKTIGAYELMVAATAMEHGSAVATFHRRHFEGVPGLQIIEAS